MRKNGTAGFSLIEVLAAIAILGIAMTAVFSTFLFQQKSYTTQVRVAEMQQNLRDAMEMVSRDIRMCTYGIPFNVNIVDNEITSRFLKPVNSASAPDEITVLYRYDGDAAYPSDNVNLAAGATTVTLASTDGIVAGDRILVYNATNADLRKVTAVTASPATLTFQGGLVTDYSAGGTLARVRYSRYFVDRTTDPAHPTLMLDRRNGQPPQPLADDIEDLQLQYSMDTNGDGTIEVVDNNAVGNASFVRQLRVHLLARSRITEKGWVDTGDRNMADHTPGAASDGYHRRRTVMVVDVRNSNF
ncbi:MAG: PilW family protein [Deltaproteobacteria bacterium]|nr:PilW family protein [Candidatus Deferrimicrobium borealis]